MSENDCKHGTVIVDFVKWCRLNRLLTYASKIDINRKPSNVAVVNIQRLGLESKEFQQTDKKTHLSLGCFAKEGVSRVFSPFRSISDGESIHHTYLFKFTKCQNSPSTI